MNNRQWIRSTRGLALTLAHRLEQAHASGHRDIEAADAAGHGQLDQVIAVFAGQPTHALALGPHDQNGRTGHVLLIQLLLGLTGRTDNPQAALLQLF